MITTAYALYSCTQIRTCEQQAVESLGLDPMDLMTQAGAEAFFFIKHAYPRVKHIAVFCGKGNNAGDGYVLARLAQEHGLMVMVYQCHALEVLSPTARRAALMALDSGVVCQSAEEPLDPDVELIVDALLGIGLQGPVRGLMLTAISQINGSGLPVLSLDIPSGLHANTGYVDNACVQAETTLTFLGLKPGLFTLDGPDYCGDIHCRSLQMDRYLAQHMPYAKLLTADTLPGLRARKKNSHKADYGHVLVIGGGPGMPGAVALAAKAALRAGAGVVTIATHAHHAAAIVPLVPEAMVFEVSNGNDLAPLMARATVCVIGPGLGESPWAHAMYLTAITAQVPMVIDASALRLLAQHPQVDDNWVLTPHPGEAACLLGCSVQESQADRYASAQALQQQYGGVVVLKGVGTIVQTIDKQRFVCPKGNPGMASAGMGDVLSGIIAGLCAQGLSLSDAATLGVWLHAFAGDKAAAKALGHRGVLARDVIDLLPLVLNAYGK